MGWFFKSKEEKAREQQARQQQEQQAARQGWIAAQASGDYDRMRPAFGALSMGASDEYLAAAKVMIDRFPHHAGTTENDVGVHFFFSEDYERAVEHYARSYAIDGPGSCARANILEACQKLAENAEDDKVAVKHLLRYFTLCTGKVDPEERVENITLLSLFTDMSRSLAEVEKEEAEDLVSSIRGYLEDIEDKAFVQETEAGLKRLETQLGLESA